MSGGMRVVKTEYERCAPAGEALLAKAKEHALKKRTAGNSDISQLSKSLAKHICGMATDRLTVNMNISQERFDQIFGGNKNA